MLTPEQELEFCRLRREIIGLNYQTLNSEQRRAVLATEGPLLLLAGALLLGLFAGPLSALLGFYIFDRIPEGNRGSALGTQNSLTLDVSPVAVFATSLIVEAWGAGAAALALAVCWGAATIWALTTHTLRDLAEEDGSAAAPSDVRTADRNAGPAAVGAEHPSVLAE